MVSNIIVQSYFSLLESIYFVRSHCTLDAAWPKKVRSTDGEAFGQKQPLEKVNCESCENGNYGEKMSKKNEVAAVETKNDDVFLLLSDAFHRGECAVRLSQDAGTAN
jgi:hypothetical protein